MVSPVQGNGPHWFSLILVGVWLSGFLTALTVSFLRWRRISQIVRRTLPIHEGREFEALRPVERAHKIVRPIGLLLSGDPTGDEGTAYLLQQFWVIRIVSPHLPPHLPNTRKSFLVGTIFL
jgi:hypothetical protein